MKNPSEFNPFIQSLRDVPTDPQLIGMKALNLKKLASMNVPIPKTAVIPSTTYRRLVQPTGLSAAEIIQRIDGLELSDFAESLTRYLRSEFGDVPIVVRSSSNYEDLETGSFAGQYDSFVDLPIDEVGEAICLCWKSLWSEAVLSYRDIGEEEPVMAVIIQPFVRGSLSGVAYSAHPVTGNPFEFLFNYTEGSCCSVTDGDKGTKLFSVFVKDLSDRQEVPEPFRTVADLLCRFEYPVDIEWTVDESGTVVYLQLRRIVQKSRFRPASSLKRFNLRVPEIFSPLGRDLEFQRNRIYNRVIRSLGQPKYRLKLLSLYNHLYSAAENDQTHLSLIRLSLNLLSSLVRVPLYLQLKRSLASRKRLKPQPEKSDSVADLLCLIDQYFHFYFVSIYAGYLYTTLSALIIRYACYVTKGTLSKSILYHLLVYPRNITAVRDDGLHELASLFRNCEGSDWLDQQSEQFKKLFRTYNSRFGYVFSHTHPLDPYSRVDLEVARSLLLNFSGSARQDSNNPTLVLIERDVANRPLGWLHLKVLRLLRISFQLVAPIKEGRNHLFYCHTARLRDFIENHAESLRDSLSVASTEDIYFCTLGDIRRRRVDPKKVDLRKIYYRLARDHVDPYPAKAETLPLKSTHSMKGIPCSPGLAVGPVLFLLSRQDLTKARPGSILVTHHPRPFWTPIIRSAGGMLSATGNLLSHGASIARESQVPAIFGLGEEIFQLREGEVVSIDGSKGIIFRNEEEKTADPSRNAE